MAEEKKKKPKVRSVGTIDFNVNTPEGKAAYEKAKRGSRQAARHGKDVTKAASAAINKPKEDPKPPEKPKDTTPAKGDKNPKTVKALKIAGAVADAVGTFAGQMSAAHKESWKGVNPRATKVRSGEKGSTYNYQPKDMATGDTSPMVRYDSDYEKEKRKLGL